MKFSVKNLWKSYGKNQILKGYSYDFESGLYLLTGTNGIGKSTLLKLIAKVIYPSNSNYHIDSKKVAYLCEKAELSSDKVETYLKLICRLNHTTINIKELLEKWKIPNKNISHLSKGNKQKVAILMMSLTSADIYLFDEPTDSLDTIAKEHFCKLVESFLNDEKIVFICTHEKQVFKDFSYKEIMLQ